MLGIINVRNKIIEDFKNYVVNPLLVFPKPVRYKKSRWEIYLIKGVLYDGRSKLKLLHWDGDAYSDKKCDFAEDFVLCEDIMFMLMLAERIGEEKALNEHFNNRIDQLCDNLLGEEFIINHVYAGNCSGIIDVSSTQISVHVIIKGVNRVEDLAKKKEDYERGCAEIIEKYLDKYSDILAHGYTEDESYIVFNLKRHRKN